MDAMDQAPVQRQCHSGEYNVGTKEENLAAWRKFGDIVNDKDVGVRYGSVDARPQLPHPTTISRHLTSVTGTENSEV